MDEDPTTNIAFDTKTKMWGNIQWQENPKGDPQNQTEGPVIFSLFHP